MLEYVAKFIELARLRDDYVATHMAKVRKFKDGLNFPKQKIFVFENSLVNLRHDSIG